LLTVVVLVWSLCWRAEKKDVHSCVFFSLRRRPALRGCTTFYKLDVRFTYLTRRNS